MDARNRLKPRLRRGRGGKGGEGREPVPVRPRPVRRSAAVPTALAAHPPASPSPGHCARQTVQLARAREQQTHAHAHVRAQNTTHQALLVVRPEGVAPPHPAPETKPARHGPSFFCWGCCCCCCCECVRSFLSGGGGGELRFVRGGGGGEGGRVPDAGLLAAGCLLLAACWLLLVPPTAVFTGEREPGCGWNRRPRRESPGPQPVWVSPISLFHYPTRRYGNFKKSPTEKTNRASILFLQRRPTDGDAERIGGRRRWEPPSQDAAGSTSSPPQYLPSQGPLPPQEVPPLLLPRRGCRRRGCLHLPAPGSSGLCWSDPPGWPPLHRSRLRLPPSPGLAGNDSSGHPRLGQG